MKIILIFVCCVAYMILGKMLTPFRSPYPQLNNEEFTVIINGIICFIIASILILTL